MFSAEILEFDVSDFGSPTQHTDEGRAFVGRRYTMRIANILFVALVASIVSLFGIGQTANAAISFDINVSRGPVSTSIYSDGANIVTFGGTNDYAIGTPYYFGLLGDTIEATDFIVSSNTTLPSGGFASWLGQTNPTGNFSQEVGNRLYFGDTWITSATPISLDKLTFSITSAPNPILNQTLMYGTFGQGGLVRGWNYGPDGVPNTGDDFYDTGEGNPPMNVIVVCLGLGNGVNAVNAPGSTNQEKLDNTVEAILLGGAVGSGLEGGIETITFTVSYDWGSSNIESASKVLSVNGYDGPGNLPEPASLALFAVGSVLLCSRRTYPSIRTRIAIGRSQTT